MQLSNIAPQIDKDTHDVETDATLKLIASKTSKEIEAYFEANVSGIALATDAEIDTYVDAITDLADAKVMLKHLAKDSAFNSNMLKKITKAVALLSAKATYQEPKVKVIELRSDLITVCSTSDIVLLGVTKTPLIFESSLTTESYTSDIRVEVL